MEKVISIINNKVMIKRIKSYIANIPHKYIELLSYRARYKFAKSDLAKTSNVKPITKEQKKIIQNYWKPFLNNSLQEKAFDIKWFDVYNYTNKFGYKLERYIPDSFYYSIVDPYLTNVTASYVMDDKNLYDLYFPDANKPKTIIHKINRIFLDDNYNIISENEAVNKCIQYNVIVKPSVSTVQGKGIVAWKKDNDIEELKKALKSVDNLVVQEFIEQHQVLSDFCDSCVNTMRLVTLLWKNEVHLTSSVLIMGGANAKTNHLHGGGIVCGILPSGQLQSMAFDGKLNCYEKHPNGQVFSEITVPNFEKCVDMVKKLAPRLSGVSKLLNWDVTLDKDGNPILIEVNITWGGSVQIAGGPALGDLTEEILTAIAQQNK